MAVPGSRGDGGVFVMASSAGARVFRTARREGFDRHRSPTGEVGRIHRGSGFEVVWVYKQGEAVDRAWFSMRSVDVLIVVRGRLRVEYADPRTPLRTLGVGDVLVLAPRTKCRAYRWPRSARGPTIFVAIYPRRSSSSSRPRSTSHRA